MGELINGGVSSSLSKNIRSVIDRLYRNRQAESDRPGKAASERAGPAGSENHSQHCYLVMQRQPTQVLRLLLGFVVVGVASWRHLILYEHIMNWTAKAFENLDYFPPYINKSIYARAQHTYQPSTGIMEPGTVNQQALLVPLALAESRGPFRIGPDSKRALISQTPNAISNGEGFTVDIRHDSLSSGKWRHWRGLALGGGGVMEWIQWMRVVPQWWVWVWQAGVSRRLR